MVHRPIDVPFESLTLDHVRAFLESAGEEGVNWEAKADGGNKAPEKRLRTEHVQRAVCGLANQIGGHVIVGAKQAGNKWELPGVTPPSDEMELWLDQALRWLRPAPRYLRRAWSLDDGRLAAVVEVEPLTETPCMTADGQVFERVSSETVKVTDPARLGELSRRGREARAEAERRADSAAGALLEHPSILRGRSVWISLGLAAASYEPDIGRRLFHSRFNTELHRAAGQRLFEDLGQSSAGFTAGRAMTQSSIEFSLEAENLAWAARGSWDGAAGIVAGLSGDLVETYAITDYVIVPAWKLAGDLVRAVGGYADGHLTLKVKRVAADTDEGIAPIDVLRQEYHRVGPMPASRTLWGKLPPEVTLRRTSLLTEPTDDEIGSVQREVERAAGLFVFEGTPDPPGDETSSLRS